MNIFEFKNISPITFNEYKKINEKDALQRINFDIHAYIRRQQTWFKKNAEIKWFDINTDDLFDYVYNIN